MKKLLSIILILAMLVSVVACGEKQTAVNDVIKLINEIGDVGSESGEAIDTAQRAYDSLSKEEKQKVSNHILLMNANTKYQGLKLYLEVQELEANGKADEAQAKLDAAWKSGDESYWEYLRIADERKADPQYANNMVLRNAEDVARNFGPEYSNKISNDSKTIGLPDYAVEGITYEEIAKGYGFDNLYYTVNPQTDEEHWNNVRYLLLTGKWDYKKYSMIIPEMAKEPEWTSIPVNGSYEGQYLVCNQDIALMSYFHGGSFDVYFYFDGTNYHVAPGRYDIAKFPTPDEIRRQIVEAYRAARVKYDEFRKKGLIKESSTQYQIAKVYADWYSNVKFVFPQERLYVEGFHEEGWDIDISAAYKSLVDHVAKCDTHTAAFCLLMRMEGIEAYGLPCEGAWANRRIGHIVPWMLLDGVEYIYEFNNKEGLVKIDDKQNAIVNNPPLDSHLLQQYHYNQILKRAGLEYDSSFDKRSFWDDDGNALTEEEWIKIR